jgi:diguanylate cyclase (GGDEF)-like protein
MLEVLYVSEEALMRGPGFPRYDTRVVLYQVSDTTLLSYTQLGQMFPYAAMATFSEDAHKFGPLSQSKGFARHIAQDNISSDVLVELAARPAGTPKSDMDLAGAREQLLSGFFSDFIYLIEMSTRKNEFAIALEELAGKIAASLNSERCLFYFYIEGESRFCRAVISQTDDSQNLMDFYFNNTILEEVTSSGVPFVDNSFEGKMADGPHKATPVRSILCYPLIKDTKRIGVIEVINKLDGGAFKEEDIEFLSRLALPLSVIIDNATLFQNVEQLSYTDDVTKLYNSRYAKQFLNTEVKRSLRYKKKVSLLFLDIDRFKAVNDVYGHLVGSETLMEFGRVLKNTVRETDIAVRYGGDEYIIILPETPTDKANEVAERIRTRVENYRFGVKHNLKIHLTVTNGVATCPDHALTAEGLIQKADTAMYQAKVFRNSTRVAE